MGRGRREACPRTRARARQPSLRAPPVHILTCGKDSTLRLLDARSLGAPLATLRAPGFRAGAPVCTAALGPDSKHAACGSADGTVLVWEVATGAVARTLGRRGGAPPLAVAWSPQGSPLAVADRGGGVSLWTPADEAGGGGRGGGGGGGARRTV